MGVGAVLEPLVVIVLLFGGTWINRVVNPSRQYTLRKSTDLRRAGSSDSLESGYSSPSTKDGLLGSRSHSPLPDDGWHKRQVGLLWFKFEVTSPNTTVFQDRLLSRLLRKFPFLVECWYWALVYWVSLFTPALPSSKHPTLSDSYRNLYLCRHTSSVVPLPPSPSRMIPSMSPEDMHYNYSISRSKWVYTGRP